MRSLDERARPWLYAPRPERPTDRRLAIPQSRAALYLTAIALGIILTLYASPPSALASARDLLAAWWS